MAIYTPGEIVADRYRVSQALSQGGMGAVYLAEQISLGRQVALKVILAHHQDSEALRRRFDSEARAVCKLHHPNIITYHDYGHDEEGRPFLVMEFLAGYPGTDFVYGPTVPSVDSCVHVLGQLASALAEAHQHGIIHRDLKWSNAMIVPQSHDPLFTKLIDFGILKVATDGSTGDQRRELTRTGVLLGTPQYMSPEAIVGHPIDGRADQYSLAVMAYELLTGRRPFETDSQLELLRQHVQEPPPPMDDIGPSRERMPELEAVIFRGMAKQPGERFATITEFHAAMARAVGLPEPTGPSPARRVTARGPAAGRAPTPVARPGAGPSIIAGRTDPRLGRGPGVRTGESALPPHRTPSAAPVDTAAETGSRPRQSAPLPRWVWILGAVGLVAIGFAVTVLVAGLDSGPPPGPEVAVHVTPPAAPGEHGITPVAPDAGPTDVTTANTDEDTGATTVAEADTTREADAAVALAAAPDTRTAEAPDTHVAAAPPDTTAPVAVAHVPKTPKTATRRVVGDGTITVSAKPYATIILDGEELGTSSFVTRKVRAGRHKLEFVHPNFGTRSKTVTVRPDKTTKVRMDMER